MTALNIALSHYLHDTLGVGVSILQPWAGQDQLPYFLRDALDVCQLELHGHTVLAAVDNSPERMDVSAIRQRLDKLRATSGYPVLYVTAALASYERKRLIEHKIPFIVPGNQLYLPDLGIDLREHFRRRPLVAQEQISPSAQAMLLSVMLSPHWPSDWQPAETAHALGYTPMTLSRAVRELAATGIASAHKAGRSLSLKMLYSPQETWERIQHVLRNPVLRTAWLPDSVADRLSHRLAGISALARSTMLDQPVQPLYALNRLDWPPSNAQLESPDAMPGYRECQLWAYSPALQEHSDMVDPLSLILSLRDNPDERIQMAIDELKGQLPWSKV